MQSEIIIRPMRLDDLDVVYRLEQKLFPNPWPKSFFKHDLQSRGTIAFVVEGEDSLIGYSIASCKDQGLHVTNIAVDTAHQRHGIGSRLMQKLERIAMDRGCRYVYLEVRTNNLAAIDFYKHLYYTIAYTRQHYYIDGDDAYVMEKELA